jgi:hypothetical protein
MLSMQIPASQQTPNQGLSKMADVEQVTNHKHGEHHQHPHHVTHAAELLNLPAAQVQSVEVPFGFKSTIDPDTKEKIPARPKITLNIPYPTWEGLITKLRDEDPEKAPIQNYLMRLIRDDVISAARIQVSDELKPVNSQEELDLAKLTLDFLANQPESERRGGGIAKEIWESFAKNYVEVKTALGKELQKADAAAKLFVKKLQPCRDRKQVLAFLKGELDTWFQATDKESQEEYAGIYEFLVGKIDTFMKADEASLLLNL